MTDFTAEAQAALLNKIVRSGPADLEGRVLVLDVAVYLEPEEAALAEFLLDAAARVD
jgi:hypothetical protein